MLSNRQISKLFSIYAELLLLHEKNEKLAALLSGASFRLRKMTEEISALSKTQLSEVFRPEIIVQLEELKKQGTIEALDELIQLTPLGLFEMMGIKALGGKKFSVHQNTLRE